MRSVTVAVHRINGVNAPALDEAGLRSVFASAGITLTLVQGSPLPSDPAVRPNFHFRNLVPEFQQQGASTGHLIIGNRHPSNDREIAGELADLATRGLCVVYAGSRYIRDNGALGLLQTAAHEIGH
ncbi:MAG TPA: hypothetical protein VEW26_09845, partial [Allosphingosinicella sp.]|nr:hypothetical protein [Allosphingosinicella sp.]